MSNIRRQNRTRPHQQAQNPDHFKKLQAERLRIHYGHKLLRSPCWTCLNRYDRLLIDVIYMKLVDGCAHGEWINGAIPIS